MADLKLAKEDIAVVCHRRAAVPQCICMSSWYDQFLPRSMFSRAIKMNGTGLRQYTSGDWFLMDMPFCGRPRKPHPLICCVKRMIAGEVIAKNQALMRARSDLRSPARLC